MAWTTTTLPFCSITASGYSSNFWFPALTVCTSQSLHSKGKKTWEYWDPWPPSLEQHQAMVPFFICTIPLSRSEEGIWGNTLVSTKIPNSDAVSSSIFDCLLHLYLFLFSHCFSTKKIIHFNQHKLCYWNTLSLIFILLLFRVFYIYTIS